MHFEELEGFYVLPALLLGPSTALFILMNTIKVILGCWLFLLLEAPLSFIHSSLKLLMSTEKFLLSIDECY